MAKGSKENTEAPPISEASTDLHALSAVAQVEHLAGLQFTLFEVARIIGEPVEDELLIAYHRGALLGEAKVREAIKRLAVRGSSPAQKQYADPTAATKQVNRRRT